MNREYFFDYGREDEGWSFSETFSRWSWGIICCGVPGTPCSYCNCCRKTHEEEPPTVAMISSIDPEPVPIPTCERELPHRPQALRGRKSTPELMSAVKSALTQLQSAPQTPNLGKAPEKEAPEIEAPQNETPQKNVFEKEVQKIFNKAPEKQDACKKGETG